MREKIVKETYTDLRGKTHEVVIPVERPWGRRATLEQCQNYLTNGFHVVEFGTARRPGGINGDGWSTLFWATLATKLHGCVWTFDVNAEAINFSKWLTKEHRESGRVVHFEMDGYTFLEQLGNKIKIETFFPLWYFDEYNEMILKEYRIDLLYLDGPDNPNPPYNIATHAEFDYDILVGLWEHGVYPHYILLDDVHKGKLQKGAKIVPFLNYTKDIKEIFFCNSQALYEYTGSASTEPIDKRNTEAIDK